MSRLLAGAAWKEAKRILDPTGEARLGISSELLVVEQDDLAGAPISPWPMRAPARASLALPKPSSRQTTLADSRFQRLSQTVPHSPFFSTSTRPSPILSPPFSRTRCCGGAQGGSASGAFVSSPPSPEASWVPMASPDPPLCSPVAVAAAPASFSGHFLQQRGGLAHNSPQLACHPCRPL